MKYSTWDKNRVCAFLMSWNWTFGVSSSLWPSSVLQVSSLDVSAFCSLSGWAHTASVMLRSGSGQAHPWPTEMKLQPIRSFPVFVMALFSVHKSFVHNPMVKSCCLGLWKLYMDFVDRRAKRVKAVSCCFLCHCLKKASTHSLWCVSSPQSLHTSVFDFLTVWSWSKADSRD